MGDHVALVVRVIMVEQKFTNSGDTYLEAYGTDTEGTLAKNLRLWRYADGDLAEGSTYIIRGLKVALAKQWDDNEWKYVVRADGSKSLECTSRTAVEDVSHIATITTLFP